MEAKEIDYTSGRCLGYGEGSSIIEVKLYLPFGLLPGSYLVPSSLGTQANSTTTEKHTSTIIFGLFEYIAQVTSHSKNHGQDRTVLPTGAGWSFCNKIRMHVLGVN